MLNPQLTQDPSGFLYLQSTVSPSFSQGAPNPKKAGENLPPRNINAVAADLQKQPALALDFPALKVFTVDDPDDQTPLTFSLDTRRLLAFRKGKVHQVHTQPAPIRELRTSTWKMTNVEGGWVEPHMTGTSAQRDTSPAAYTTLYKLKMEIENASRAEDALCAQQHVAGEAREQRLDDAVIAALQRFNLR